MAAAKPKKTVTVSEEAQVRPFRSTNLAMAAGLGERNMVEPTAANSRAYRPDWEKIKKARVPVEYMLSRQQQKKYAETGELPATLTSAHIGSHGYLNPVSGAPNYALREGDPRQNVAWTDTREALRGRAKAEVAAGINAPWPNKPYLTPQEKATQQRIAKSYWSRNNIWKPTAEGLALMHEPYMENAAAKGARNAEEAAAIQGRYEADVARAEAAARAATGRGLLTEENDENLTLGMGRVIHHSGNAENEGFNENNENNDNIEEMLARMTPAELDVYLKQELGGRRGGKRRGRKATRKQKRRSGTKRRRSSR